MPTSLSVDQHLDALADASLRMATCAEAAGLDAPVPTCPTWTVRSLLAHQSMVHRWATAHVAGTDPEAVPKQTAIAAEEADLIGYFRAGADALVAAFRSAPDDLAAMVFLKDAPPPRRFWARRQAHETTIHAVDALSASLGRLPAAAEAAPPPDLALDGVDELLCGFFTRGRTRLFDGRSYTVLVAPHDADRRWLSTVGESLTTDAGPPAGVTADVTVTGTAAAVYLGLWNRGDEIQVHGDDGFVERWRSVQRVRWS